VREPIIYLPRVADVPPDARYLLLQPKQEQEAISSAQWHPRSARPLLRLDDYRKKQLVLLEIGAGI
jgi:hypothetical protein